MDAINGLWGGSLTGVELDPALRAGKLFVARVNAAVLSNYIIGLSGITEFSFKTAAGDPWSYAEITEIHIRGTKEDGFELALVLWDEDVGGLVAGCSEVSCNEVTEAER